MITITVPVQVIKKLDHWNPNEGFLAVQMMQAYAEQQSTGAESAISERLSKELENEDWERRFVAERVVEALDEVPADALRVFVRLEDIENVRSFDYLVRNKAAENIQAVIAHTVS
jgi:hypothetical protein